MYIYIKIIYHIIAFLIWLEVGTTNNDPGVIAYYYLHSIMKLQGIYHNVNYVIKE